MHKIWLCVFKSEVCNYTIRFTFQGTLSQPLSRFSSLTDSKHKYAWCHFSAKTDYKHFNLHNVLMKTKLYYLEPHILFSFHPYRLSNYNVSWIKTQPCTIIIFPFTPWCDFIMIMMKWQKKEMRNLLCMAINEHPTFILKQ